MKRQGDRCRRHHEPIWRLSWGGWLVQMGGVGSDISVGTILGISENAYRHTQSEKTRKIIIFALFERKNYRLTTIKLGDIDVAQFFVKKSPQTPY